MFYRKNNGKRTGSQMPGILPYNQRIFFYSVAGDHLNGKWLFTWQSLVMSLVVSCFVPPFSNKMSWMRSGTGLSQFLRILFIPTVTDLHVLLE